MSGIPAMAWKIPIATQSYEWDADKGGRSAIAANMLAKAGFANVHNIVDGMEGDGNGDSESTPNGGWKYTGCPWTKNLKPERMVLP